jgi:hypothetical protein
MNVVRKLMNGDQFLDWRQDQPGRWELVSGTPVRMMAGAKQRHDRIVVNLIADLRNALRGSKWRPWSADIADLGAVLALDRVGVSLPLVDIYQDVTFEDESAQ